MVPKILLINGSMHGSSGNTSQLLRYAENYLKDKATVVSIPFSEDRSFLSFEPEIRSSNGFIFGTGTYWDSWGSPMQRFLEEATATEGSEIWLGKPAGVIITMHSVGGKGVLSRLQGVLNTFGLIIPPMSGMVYSAVNQLALSTKASPIHDDLWRTEDIEVICHNILQAATGLNQWRTWDLDRESFQTRWLE